MPVELGDEAREAVATAILGLLGERAAEAWPGWMTIATGARYIDSTEDALRKLIARHAIPYSQPSGIGGRIFLSRRDLDEWLLRGRV